MKTLIATADVDIDAAPDDVWAVLTDPGQIKLFMFGTQVETTWQEGSPITWKGEYEGRRYEDKGKILKFEPSHVLQMTHFSPLSGQKDEPANYHTVTYTLEPAGSRKTHVTLEQDNNGSEDEAKHSAANWQTMLDGLKQTVEG